MAKDEPERRTGLTSKTFKLTLDQSGSGPGKGGGTLTLEVTDTDGNDYVLVSKPVKDDADLIALLLRRIANNSGEAGWTFDADYYASKNKGSIIDPR
jgi:hypothetical protein